MRNPDSSLQCDMRKDCTNRVTHIGYKGFIYCAEHAKGRRYYAGENCRKMRVWELNLIRAGKPLPCYQPIRKPQAA